MFSVAVTGVLKKYFSYIILFSRLLLLIRFHLYFIAEAFLRCLATFGCLLVFRRGTFSSDHSPSAGGACWLWPHCRGARRRQTPCLHCWVFFFGLTRFPREAFRFLPRDPPPSDQEVSGELRGAGLSGVRQCLPVSLFSGRGLHPQLCPAPRFLQGKNLVSNTVTEQLQAPAGQGGCWEWDRF